VEARRVMMRFHDERSVAHQEVTERHDHRDDEHQEVHSGIDKAEIILPGSRTPKRMLRRKPPFSGTCGGKCVPIQPVPP